MLKKNIVLGFYNSNYVLCKPFLFKTIQYETSNYKNTLKFQIQKLIIDTSLTDLFIHLY